MDSTSIREQLDHARRRLDALSATAHLRNTWEERQNAYTDADAERARIAWLERDLADTLAAEHQQMQHVDQIAAAATATGQPLAVAIAHTAGITLTVAPAPAGQSAPDAAGVTYAPRGAALKTTGHYRRPGTTELYCGRPAGTRNGIFRDVNGWKLCTRCVKAEKRDRDEAAAVAEQHREDTTADQPAAASTWRSDWIGATPDDGLFTLTPDREQGALFA